MLKLEARHTYLNGSGSRVNIAGLAKCPPIEGLKIFWSIQGNWYANDGRSCSLRRITDLQDGKPKHLTEQMLPIGSRWYERVLRPAGQHDNLVSEDASDEAKAWWVGVVT